jgi:hypothetical protein
MVDSCAGHGLGGHTAQPHPDQFDAGASEGSGWQGDMRAGHVPDLHETGDMERCVRRPVGRSRRRRRPWAAVGGRRCSAYPKSSRGQGFSARRYFDGCHNCAVVVLWVRKIGVHRWCAEDSHDCCFHLRSPYRSSWWSHLQFKAGWWPGSRHLRCWSACSTASELLQHQIGLRLPSGRPHCMQCVDWDRHTQGCAGPRDAGDRHPASECFDAVVESDQP